MESQLSLGRAARAGMVWTVLIVSMAGPMFLMENDGWGEVQESRRGYHSGQVTGKQGNSIQIDKKDYELDSSVVVKDDEDRARELKDVKEGAEVEFHLRRDKIDVIVLILPK